MTRGKSDNEVKKLDGVALYRFMELVRNLLRDQPFQDLGIRHAQCSRLASVSSPEHHRILAFR